MARNLNPPRTAFHRRLQGMTLELENGFGQVNNGFKAIHARLEADLKSMNDNLGALTVAVNNIPGKSDVVLQILQVNIMVVLGHLPWKMIAVDVDDPLKNAVEQMHKHTVSTMLVTERNQVVGMISASQIIAAVHDNSLATPLRKCMVIRKDFYCANQSDSVASALRKLLRHPVKRLFVVDEQAQVCGILTLGLLMRWLAERLLEHDAAGR
jgi:CBS domain-containing protein